MAPREAPHKPPSEPPSRATPRRTRLVAIAGNNAGQVFALRPPTLIGRSSSADVVLDDPQVSKRHARIDRDASGAFWLEDLGSRNSSYVNTVAIERARLTPGDRIRLGNRSVLQLTEQDNLEATLLARQRLEAVGRQALGVAHDFNNMLGVLHAGLDYLLACPPTKRDEQAVNECLDDMRAACNRAAELATRLLGTARQQPGPHVPVDLSATCREVVSMLRRTVRRDIEIDGHIAAGLVLRGDSTSLHQAVTNLCLNARDAMPHGGTLTVSARRKPAAGDDPPWGTIVLTVCDTGIGMSAEIMARIFEPFYTTKAAGLGFGLGLASVREIAERHGGEIEIDSEVGRGTELRVLLPGAPPQESQQAFTPPPQPSRPPGTGVTVLLADDEAVVRRSIRRLLEHAGYTVIEAADGQQAVAMWTATQPKPTVAVLDVDMPHIDGVTAYRQLQAVAPKLAAVFLSGHYDPACERQITALGASELLLKPHSADTLLSAVAAALTETGGPDIDPAGAGPT